MAWPQDIDTAADRVEVFPWTRETARERKDLTAGVLDFKADASKNPEAAKATEGYLKEMALDDDAKDTRIFVIDDKVLGFYSLSVGEAQVASSHRRKSMGARSFQTRIPTAHIDWIARDHRAPKQTGRLLIEHAVGFARQDIHDVIPVLALTLDPYDAATSAMWHEQFGFRETATEIDEDLVRLYVPLRGHGSFRSVLPNSPS